MNRPELSDSQIVVEIPQSDQMNECVKQPSTGAKISTKSRSSNNLSLTVDSPSDAWLLITDSFYVGWMAILDGEQVEIYPANIAFRAVRIPQGNHELSMVYRPISFYAGAGLSSFTLLYLLLALKKISRVADH